MMRKEDLLQRLEVVIRKMEELPEKADYVKPGWEKEALMYDLRHIERHVRFVRDYLKVLLKDE